MPTVSKWLILKGLFFRPICYMDITCRNMVERVGFEPTKAEPADLQSAPVDRLGTSPILSFMKAFGH